MAWSSEFLANLSAQTVAPKWALEFMPGYDGLGPGADLVITSHESADLNLGPEISVGGGRISPGTWSYTAGSWSVQVVGSLYTIIDAGVQRGNLARLMMGFEGWDVDDFECVALGALSSIQGVAPVYTVTFSDILSHLQSRHDNDASRLALFDSLDLNDADLTPVTSALTSNYDPATSSTVVVSNLSSFEIGDTRGVVMLSDDENEPFFLTYTSVTSTTTFNGILTSDLCNTTRVSLDTTKGAVAQAGAFLEGHPVDIARQVLASTSGTSNGSYDDLPQTWGLAVYDDWLDHEDMDDWKAIIGNPAGTTHDWEVVVLEGQASAFGWLSGILAPAGIWIVVRQGQLSVRAAQNLDESSSDSFSPPLTAEVSITDDDIEAITNHYLWHPEASVEAMTTKVWYNSGHSSVTAPDSVSVTDLLLTTLPGTTWAEHDLTGVIFQAHADPATDVANRCHTWETRIPESISIQCRSLRLAQLCPGDVVSLTTDKLEGRLPETTDDGYVDELVMVTSVSVDWTSGIVDLELAAPSNVAGT